MLQLIVVDGRGIWGSKKKKEEDASPPPSANTASRRNTNHQVPQQQKQQLNTNDDRSNEVMRAIYTLIDSMEEMMNSKDFMDVVTPDSVQEILRQVPGSDTNPEMQMLLNSPAFNDPELLAQTMTTGISQLRVYANELGHLLSDPNALDAILITMPEDIQIAVRGFLSGNLIAVRDVLERTPGIEQNQIDIAMQLLEGDLEGMADSLKDMVQKQLSDPKMIEQTRQQLLAEPEVAEALGISMNDIKDKKKWKKLVENEKEKFGGDGLNNFRDAGLNIEGLMESGRQFGKAEMA